jgi:dienelactone hydrolase
MSYGEELKKKVEYTYQTADTKKHSGSFGFCYGTGTVFYDG